MDFVYVESADRPTTPKDGAGLHGGDISDCSSSEIQRFPGLSLPEAPLHDPRIGQPTRVHHCCELA